jgi:hypothetical protein
MFFLLLFDTNISIFDASLMKYSSSLTRNLRALVGAIRIITLVGLFTTPILLAPLPIMATKGAVNFVTSPSGLHTATDLALKGTRVDVETLIATVDIIPAAPMPADLLTLRRETMVPAAFATILIWFLISHFLWHLLRRLEKGEVFTAENLKLLHRIGVAIIACTFIEAAAKVWGDLQVAEFVKHHVEIAGLTVQHNALSNFDTRFLITGCVVLVLSEVFRQGLALKQETELTV